MELYEELKNVKVPYIEKYVVTNKDYDWLVDNFKLWAKHNNADIKRSLKCDHMLMVAQLFPFCESKERLLNIGLITWLLFEFDDKVEELYRAKNELMLNRFCEELSDVLKTRSLKNNDFEICVWFHKSLQLLAKTINGRLETLIVETITDWFNIAKYVNINYRLKNKYISLSAYKQYRRVDICALYCIYFVEYALGIQLKDHIREMSAIKEFHLLIIDRSFIGHDLASALHIEFMEGEIMNYVFAVKYDKKCSFQEAVNIAHEDMVNIEKKIIECAAKIENDVYIQSEEPMIFDYIKGVKFIGFGGIDWTQKSIRYFVEDVSKSDVNWRQLKDNIENSQECQEYVPLKSIIGRIEKYSQI